MAKSRESPLAEEISYYQLHKAEWIRSHAGEFVVICGASVAGFFPDYEKAFKAGLRNFGVRPAFLIKQVLEHEPVYAIY
jgi:hypothetical protein